MQEIHYAPFNVSWIDQQLWVSFVKQNESKSEPNSGVGNGFIDVFAQDCKILKRFTNRGSLDTPFAVVQYRDQILIGNNGNGHLSLFDNDSYSLGIFCGSLRNANDAPIVIDNIRGITIDENQIYFAAGVNSGQNGLIGMIILF